MVVVYDISQTSNLDIRFSANKNTNLKQDIFDYILARLHEPTCLTIMNRRKGITPLHWRFLSSFCCWLYIIKPQLFFTIRCLFSRRSKCYFPVQCGMKVHDSEKLVAQFWHLYWYHPFQRGVIYGTQLGLQCMDSGGTIINTASSGGTSVLCIGTGVLCRYRCT